MSESDSSLIYALENIRSAFISKNFFHAQSINSVKHELCPVNKYKHNIKMAWRAQGYVSHLSPL